MPSDSEIRSSILRPLLFSSVSFTFFLVTFCVFQDALILLLGFLFSIVIFFLFTESEKPDSNLTLRPMRLSGAHIYSVLVVGSILLLMALPSVATSLIAWQSIPAEGWVRYLATLLLLTFLPGYGLLYILGINNRLNSAGVLLFSFLLGIAVTVFIGFGLEVFKTIVSLGGSSIFVANLLLMVGTWVKQRYRPEKQTGFSIPASFLFATTLILVECASIVVMIRNMPLTPGDMYTHLSVSLQFRSGFPVHGHMLLPGYPYAYYLFLDLLMGISSVPAPLAEQGLYVFSFIPVLGIYAVASRYFDQIQESFISKASAFLSVLLGFGGLYLLYVRAINPGQSLMQYLQTATLHTYDIYLRLLFLPDIAAPIWIIGIPCFLALLCLVKKGMTAFQQVVVMSLLIALDFLGHEAEALVFVVTALLGVIILEKEQRASWMGPSVLTGLIIVVVVDLLAPVRFYTVGNELLAFEGTLLLAVLLTILEFRSRFSNPWKLTDGFSAWRERGTEVWRIARWVLLILYVWLIFSWLKQSNAINVWALGGESNVPLVVDPIRLGPVLLIVVVAVFAYSKRLFRDRRLIFFLSLSLLGLVLEQLFDLYPFYPAYRLATFSLIGASIVSGFFVASFLQHRTTVPLAPCSYKRIAGCCALLVLLNAGFLSTTFFYSNASEYSASGQITPSEYQATQYLAQHLQPNQSVLTLTNESTTMVQAFAGVNPVQETSRWLYLMTSSSNPYIMNYIFASSNIKYVYLAQRDLEVAYANPVLWTYIKQFPFAFNDSEVTILSAPQLSAPSIGANLDVLRLAASLGQQNITWEGDQLSSEWKTSLSYGNVTRFAVNSTSSGLELSTTSGSPGDVWGSYAISNLKISTSEFGFLYFEYKVINPMTWFTVAGWNATGQLFVYDGHLVSSNLVYQGVSLPPAQTLTRLAVIVETTANSTSGTTAQALVNQIGVMTTAPTWSAPFQNGWYNGETYGTVRSFSVSSGNGGLELALTSAQSGDVWASYSHFLPVKTMSSVLSISYRTLNPNTWLTIQLVDNSGKVVFYEGHLTDQALTEESFALPDNESLSRIDLILETQTDSPAGTLAEAQVNFVKISQENFTSNDVLPALLIGMTGKPYSFTNAPNDTLSDLEASYSNATVFLTNAEPSDVQNYAAWANAGHTLILVDTSGDSSLQETVGIHVAGPGAFIESMGQGRIAYFDLSTQNGTISLDTSVGVELVQELSNLMGPGSGISYPSELPIYDSAQGSIVVQGNLTLSSRLLTIHGELEFQNGTSLASSLVVRGMNSTITIQDATLSMAPGESYLAMSESGNKPTELTVTGSLSPSTVSETLTVLASNYTVLAFQPSLKASGTIAFSFLDVESALYVPLHGIVRLPAAIIGTVTFSSQLVSSPVIIFSEFQYTGKVLG